MSGFKQTVAGIGNRHQRPHPHRHPVDLANTVLTTARRGALARQHGGNMMCHLAMFEGTGDGDGTTWLEPVTDEQYQAANQP